MTEPSAIDDAVALGALVLLDLVAAACLGRLFTSTKALGPILAAMLVGHAVAYATRRRNLSPVATGVAVALAGVLTAMWTVVPGHTFYGVPTPDALHALLSAIGTARRQFGVAIAPTPVTEGFSAACVCAVIVLATLADWAAFRMRTTVEAAVPAFTLFVFSAVLGTAKQRGAATLAFVAAALVWFVVHNATIVARTRPWFQGTADTGRRAVSRAGVGIGVFGLVGALIGLAVPFAQQPPAVAWRNRNRSHARTTISPLVDIRSRLVTRSDVVAFTVQTPLRAYWRLTSLDVFDGDIWSSKGSYKDVDPGKDLKGRAGDASTQTYAIGDLRSIWLPVAYRPASTPTAPGISYDDQADAFITENPTSDGMHYSVTSAVQSLTPAVLRASRPETISDQEVALPAVDPKVAALAQQITRGFTTPYDKALAIQQYLRSAPFKYDLSVPPGHSNDAVYRFLFVTHRGYCEQFAGSYAVLARLAGLPTRVAVGFTSGEYNATTGAWTVRELHAHAWPEVFLGSVGWVAFEPTPGRGIPGAESYTGAAPAQADTGRPGTASTLVPTTVQPNATAPGALAGTTTTTSPTTTTTPPRAVKHHGSLWRFVGIAFVVLLALAAVVAAVPLAVTARRRRRFAAAATPTDKVLVAWGDTDEALRFAGAPVRAAHTPSERVDTVGASIGEGGVATLTRLAQIVDVAAYGPDAVTQTDAETAWQDASVVRREAFATKPRWKLALFSIDPRRLRR